MLIQDTLRRMAFAAMLITTGKAATLTEMQAFVFPQVALTGGQSAQVCGTNMSDSSSPVQGLIAVLDSADTTKLLAKTISFSLAAGAGTCVHLPSIPRATLSDGPNVIVIIAFQSSTTWNATVGKAFISSLQLKSDGTTRAVLTPMFIPVIQVPTE
jgi:hypothetical protein